MDTTYKSEVDLYFEFEWQQKEQENTMFEIVGENQAAAPFCSRNWFFVGSKRCHCQIIEPFSRLSYIWSVIVILALCYNLFYVPISLAFEYEISDPGLMFIDCLVVTINTFDIFIKMNKGFINEMGLVEKTPANIRAIYLKNGLFADIVAAFPMDYVAYGAPQYVLALLRMFRLLKAK